MSNGKNKMTSKEYFASRENKVDSADSYPAGRLAKKNIPADRLVSIMAREDFCGFNTHKGVTCVSLFCFRNTKWGPEAPPRAKMFYLNGKSYPNTKAALADNK